MKKNTATRPCPQRILLLTVLLVTACGGTPDAELAALMPRDTIAFARIASIDQLVKNARDVAAAAGESAQSIDADVLLAPLEGMIGKTSLIDRSRPIAIALSMPRATKPSPVVLVPTTNAKVYVASLPPMGVAPVVSGSYVAVPLGQKYEKAASPPALMQDLPAGVIALRADAEQLAAAFGPIIGASLSAAQAQMAKELQSSNPGLDGEAAAEAFVSVLRSVLASARTIEIVVDYREGRLDAFAALAVKPGSELDGWGAAPLDLKALTGRLSGKRSVEVVMGADWAKLWPRLAPLMESALEMYPQQFRETVRPLLADYEKLYRALGPVAALDGDVLGADGMNLMLHLAPPDAGALQQQFESLLGHEALTKLGFEMGPARTSEADGASIRDYEMKFDADKLAASVGGNVQQAERDALGAALRLFFGGGQMPVRFATKGGRSILALGNQRDHSATLASLGGTTGSSSRQVQSALARVGDCNPVVVERLDLGAVMYGLSRLPPLQAAMPAPPPGMTADMLIGGGVRGNEWRAVFSMDLSGLARMVKAMMPR